MNTTSGTTTTSTVNSDAIWITVAVVFAAVSILSTFVAIGTVVFLRSRRGERDEEGNVPGSGTDPLLGQVEAVEKSTPPDAVAVCADLSPPSDRAEKHFRQSKTPATLAPSATSVTETTDATQIVTDNTD